MILISQEGPASGRCYKRSARHQNLFLNICRRNTEMVSLFRLVLLLAMIHSVIVSHPCDSCSSCNSKHPRILLDRCNCAINSCHGKRSADVIFKKRLFFIKDLLKYIPVSHSTIQKRNAASEN
ncbi:hypothetical protein Bpfe_003586 [Biomphalaria pfeifferi]|uniref:Uncharacterized protein n=1 Tax=Biomphalaria pfeifferi TaxID=112525 RepID=A0AAD8C5I3_BIOPF|nr:hypothetical protein Bpfe_003586 [Biomphalaria pfeifferi]